MVERLSQQSLQGRHIGYETPNLFVLAVEDKLDMARWQGDEVQVTQLTVIRNGNRPAGPYLFFTKEERDAFYGGVDDGDFDFEDKARETIFPDALMPQRRALVDPLTPPEQLIFPSAI